MKVKVGVADKMSWRIAGDYTIADKCEWDTSRPVPSGLPAAHLVLVQYNIHSIFGKQGTTTFSQPASDTENPITLLFCHCWLVVGDGFRPNIGSTHPPCQVKYTLNLAALVPVAVCSIRTLGMNGDYLGWREWERVNIKVEVGARFKDEKQQHHQVVKGSNKERSETSSELG